MKQSASSLPKYLHPVPIAVVVILLGAIMAVGDSSVEGGILRKALQSIASVPGLGWVATWITPTTDLVLQPSETEGILTSSLPETKSEGSVLLADGFQSDQAITSLQSSTFLSPTPLATGSSINPTATVTSHEVSATTTALANESLTTTPAEATTPTPIETTQGTVTPTPTELPGTRHLSLSSVEVKPGERFQVHLSCDNTEGVAGCDVGLEFEPNLLDLVTVHKTAITDPFLLVKRKESGTFILSLAGFDGLDAGNGVLLTFEGVTANSAAQGHVTVVGFTKAKLYNTESKTFEVRTSDGIIHIKRDPTELATQEAQSIPTQNPALTPLPTYSEEVDENPIPEATSALPSNGSTNPPVGVGGGYVTGLIPTNTLVVMPTPTRTPPAVFPLDAATPTPTRLRADLNKDGKVDSLDLMEFMRYWKVVFPSN